MIESNTLRTYSKNWIILKVQNIKFILLLEISSFHEIFIRSLG